jgi:RHS repeat-associated protein
VVSKDIYGVVTQTVSYEYDVNDLRVSKNVDGSMEKYFLDGDNIAFVTDGAGKQTFHYLYGMEADQVLAQDSETGMIWSLADRLGSIDVLVSEQGVIVDQRTYDSFGNTLSQLDPTVKFRFGYTGRESDPETGLYYYRARYFDANVGRFISTDPIGFEAGDSNLYRYVNNSSTLATDPTGEFINFAIGGLIGGGLDLGFQLLQNGGDFSKVKWDSVAISTISGALSGGIGGVLLKNGAGLATRTAINAGVGFNLGYWGKVAENGIRGEELTNGALNNGLFGAAGGAAGELIPAGISVAWKSKGVQTALAKSTSISENISIFTRNRVTDAQIILDSKIRFGSLTDADRAALQNVTNETVDLIKQDGSRGNKLLKGFAARINDNKKAIINASIDIEGVQVKQLRAFSGEVNLTDEVLKKNNLSGQYAPYIPNSKAYKPTVNSTDIRSSDTELKIFDEVIRLTQGNPNAAGKIKFIGNLETCYSCQKRALELREIRPNIQLDFSYEYKALGGNLRYNKIRDRASALRYNQNN